MIMTGRRDAYNFFMLMTYAICPNTPIHLFNV